MTDKHKLTKFRQALGREASKSGVYSTAKIFNCSQSLASYYRRKYEEPTYRSQKHGGQRYCKFSLEQKQEMKEIMIQQCFIKATTTVTEYRLLLIEKGFPVSRSYVQRLISGFGWSWKKPSTKQFQKFGQENVLRYIDYVMWMETVPKHKIKYLDESHFGSKDLYRNKALSPKGQAAISFESARLDTSLSLTLLVKHTADDSGPLFGELRENTNSQKDFFDFLCRAIQEGHLVSGDFLVFDNASVHTGLRIYQQIFELLTSVGVQPIFLPPYSPELNPCELAFGRIKNYLRSYRGNGSLKQEITQALSLVDEGFLQNAYDHCFSIGMEYLRSFQRI